MKQARMGWGLGVLVAVLVLVAVACEPKGSTGTGASAASGGSGGAGAKPAVTIKDEPMKPEEVAAATGGGSAAGAGGAAPAGGAAAAGTARWGGALAQLQAGGATPGITGRISFTPEVGGVRVVADVAGVSPPGNHGFHLHEVGKCERDPAGKDFTSAGGHFNPGGMAHACPDAASHHAGDLGNIVIQADGTGHLDVTSSTLSLSGPDSVVGRSVILHAGADDCTTQPTGNAGGRLACGVITKPGGAAATPGG